MIDKIFKIGLLVIGVALLIILYQSSQNNRFYFGKDQDVIFDTRTGKVYGFNKADPPRWGVFDPRSGEIKEIDRFLRK
jgi:hypothetical protein